MAKKPVMLMILDGFGIAPKGDGNAVEAAKKENFDKLVAKYPHSELQASGMAVGLPDGQMGNSEVGHLNIGEYIQKLHLVIIICDKKIKPSH